MCFLLLSTSLGIEETCMSAFPLDDRGVSGASRDVSDVSSDSRSVLSTFATTVEDSVGNK